ncbi:hypothetical protein QUF72_10705 [Desulfobacterales bacterium HSG2]|nr:hypothetical protein [Desulfobacterales bacterium HSG2]
MKTQHVIPGSIEKMGHFFNTDPESTDSSGSAMSFRAVLKKWDIFSILTRNPLPVDAPCHSDRIEKYAKDYNEGIKRIREDGTYREILKKHGVRSFK